MRRHAPIPIIDLFAGPGGLGEGFWAVGRWDRLPRFQIRLSIEKDPSAHQTLQLRSFFRQFPRGLAPDNYYLYLRREIDRAALFASSEQEWAAAQDEAWMAELGSGGESGARAVFDRIAAALDGAENWVLIGGPPCQAYSVVGRSRNKGTDDYVPEKDKRQTLYIEYLQVIADHWPSAFVMENVKGVLSSSLKNERIFQRIVEDLEDPIRALSREGRDSRGKRRRHRYRLRSLVQREMFREDDHEKFVVKAELHGIPQARHRVILVGIRDDLGDIWPNTLPERPPVPARQVLQGLPRLRSGLTETEDGLDEWRSALRRGLQQPWLKAVRDADGAEVYRQLVAALDGESALWMDRGAEFVEWPVDVGYKHTWFLDERLDGVCNHASRAHIVQDLYRYAFAASYAAVKGASPRLRHFPKALLPRHASARHAMKYGYFNDRFRVQLFDRPATTVTCHISKDGHYYIHPDPSQCRSLTGRTSAFPKVLSR